MSNQSIEVDVLFMEANQTIVIKFRCTLTLQRKRIKRLRELVAHTKIF
jgi:hypothetical protein